MKELTHGSLFSGMGGFDLGAEWAGFENKFNCEINRWCNRYLKKEFPNSKQYADITKVEAIPHVTALSAGFPCQDISIAKGDKAQGIYGTQSSLFFEVIRLANQARPDYILFENSAMLLTRGMYEVLTSLTSIGYMAEWRCLRASDFGYPHRRKRLYIIAYPISKRQRHLVFRPLAATSLSAKWTPTEAYLRVCAGRIEPSGIAATIPPHDVIPDIPKHLHGIGNAAMPVVTQYLFECIKFHIHNQNN